MEERQLVKPQNHRLVINNRKTGTVTGVLDVLSFDLNEILLETEQGMLMVKGTDMHVNRLNLEKGEVDLAGNIDNISYSDIHSGAKAGENLLSKLFREEEKNVWYRNGDQGFLLCNPDRCPDRGSLSVDQGFAQTGCSQIVADQSGGCLLLGRNFCLYLCADLSYE